MEWKRSLQNGLIKFEHDLIPTISGQVEYKGALFPDLFHFLLLIENVPVPFLWIWAC